MPIESDSLRWKQVASELRFLHHRISFYTRQFMAAGYVDTADKLERAVEIIMDTEQVARLSEKPGDQFARK